MDQMWLSTGGVFGVAVNYVGRVECAGISQSFPGGGVIVSPRGEVVAAWTGKPGEPDDLAGVILVDGFVRGTWKIRRQRRRATLLVEPFAALSDPDRHALADEGTLLLAFSAPEADEREVAFSDPA